MVPYVGNAKTTNFIYGDGKQISGLRVTGWMMKKSTKEVSRCRDVLHLIEVGLTQIYTLVRTP